MPTDCIIITLHFHSVKSHSPCRMQCVCVCVFCAEDHVTSNSNGNGYLFLVYWNMNAEDARSTRQYMCNLISVVRVRNVGNLTACEGRVDGMCVHTTHVVENRFSLLKIELFIRFFVIKINWFDLQQIICWFITGILSICESKRCPAERQMVSRF